MAIEFKDSDDIFNDDALVLVCPTSACGIMGTGLSKVFRLQYPGLAKAYHQHCRKVAGLKPYVYAKDGRAVYCLPTLMKWRATSSLEIVRDGLEAFVAWCTANDIESAALPMLGCGKGALDVRDVKPIMEELLTPGSIDFRVYCP